MGHVQDNAEECVRRAIEALKDAEYVYPMDPDFDGRPREIRVKVTVDRARREAVIDFTGTTAELATNYNAPEPVTRAAVLYVFRCLVDDDIPMNEGVMKPLRVILPAGTMLSPRYPAAVIAGNVETSQAVTSALFLALGVQAAAQSTMNNTTWGDDRLQYYETVCGGTGAGVLSDGRGHPGTSGVHSHMTNSRLTDPEVLEWRYPVVLDAFRLRRGLGRRGAVPRRGRGGAADPVPRADDGGDPVGAPGGAAAGAGRRRAGGGRADADRAGGRGGGGAGAAPTSARWGRGMSSGWRRRGAADIRGGRGSGGVWRVVRADGTAWLVSRRRAMSVVIRDRSPSRHRRHRPDCACAIARGRLSDPPQCPGTPPVARSSRGARGSTSSGGRQLAGLAAGGARRC